MNLAELVRGPVEGAPERTALVVGDTTVTYGDVGVQVARCAAQLAARGVGAGDRIALLDDCGPLLLAALLGAARLGAAVVPIHVELQVEELRKVVDLAGCGPVGIAGDAYREKLAEALGRPALGAAEMLHTRAPTPAPAMVEDDGLACVVILTSGTTGLPKPIPISHATFTPRVAGFARGFRPDAPANVSLMCVPGVHIGGIGGLLVGLASGASIVVLQRFRAGDWLRAVERHRPTSAFLVPTMLRRILDHPDFDATDLSSLRLVSYGAAAAPVALVEEMLRCFPHSVAFSNVYGQTETTGAIAVFGPADHRLDGDGHLFKAGSVGKLVPGVEQRVVDPVTGEDAATGEAGELWVRSAFNAAGGWNRTGDLVRIDADGYVFPEGRLSDTINRGGEKFGPAEIEAVLRRHPAITDAAVAGIPDPQLGERVGAAIVCSSDLDAEAIRAFCGKHLARFKLPERIAFVDEIPHTHLWKVSRKRIARLIQERGRS